MISNQAQSIGSRGSLGPTPIMRAEARLQVIPYSTESVVGLAILTGLELSARGETKPPPSKGAKTARGAESLARHPA